MPPDQTVRTARIVPPDCTHERTRFPERPVPDAWYVCPDCGERVGNRGGRIITVRENNAIAQQRSAERAWGAEHGMALYRALEQIAEMDPFQREVTNTTPGDVARGTLRDLPEPPL